MSGDIKIVIRQGTYYLAAPLVFDQRDSGRNGFKVIYCAADGEKVRIVGGKAVTGWRSYKGSICKADIGKGRVFYALFENDTWSTLACSPNTGFFTADGGSTTPKGSSLIYRQEDIKVPIDTSHARVYIWAGFNEQWYGGMNYNWWSSLLPVTDANWASRTLTLAGQSYYNIHKQNRYRIEGSLDLLDSPGEWYLDDANGIVYYWPRSVPIEKQEIIAPTCEQVLCFEGADQQHPAENITFEGVTLSVSDSIQKYFVDVEVMRAGLVLLNNARGITIRNCVIRNAGYNGIYATKFSQNHSFTGNLIEGCGYVCINLSSYAVNDLTVKSPDRLYVNKNNLISNNYLRRGGLVLGHGMGMLIFESGDNTISNNLVEDMPRYGILLLGKTTYANMMITGELYGQKITWDNHSDFICARNNKIVFNEVRDAMKDSQDAGAIGAWGLGRDNVIANNIVHDVHGKVVEGATMGIYLDDASHYTKVLNNIVYDIYGTKDTWAYCLKGVDIEFANNIAYNASETASVLVLQTDLAAVAETPVGVKYERVDNVVLKNNIFCQHGGNDIYSISPWKPTIIRESNCNVFYHPGGKYSQLVDSKRSTLDEWRMRDGREFDANSITADPLF
ncbi:MAG TPA: right-handed parallel beta-helix repeat-containing protein, partial [Methylococcales bacterium]